MDLLKILNISDIMTAMSGKYMEILLKYLTVLAVPILIIALVNCFLGHKVFKILVGIAGIFIGALVGSGISIGISMFSSKQMPSVMVIVIAGILGAFVLGFLSFKLYKAGAFVMGFITGVILGILVMKLMNKDEYIIAGVIGGLLMGLLAIDLYRHVVTLLTSINGGIVAAACLAIILRKDDPTFVLKFGIILAVAGIIVQYILLFMKKKNASEEEEDEEEQELIREKKSKRHSLEKKASRKQSKKKIENKRKSAKSTKKNRSDKKKYDYQSEFFLVEIFSNIAQVVKDFVMKRVGEDKEEEEEEFYEEDRKEESRIEEEIEEAIPIRKDQIYSSKQVTPHVIIKESESPILKEEIREHAEQVEEVNIPVFDLEDISQKLEEELEHSLEAEKDKELEDLIIKEAYRNMDK